MGDDKYTCLKLESQLCFPLYACSKEIIRRYKPYLDELDLTYTQYITMMALWEHHEMNVKELGRCLYLDSGTLTPVLKKLESKGYLLRSRSREDERKAASGGGSVRSPEHGLQHSPFSGGIGPALHPALQGPGRHGRGLTPRLIRFNIFIGKNHQFN